MNQSFENNNITEKLHIYKQVNEIVTKLIHIRKDAKFSQKFMADWLNVSRKKINEFENGKFDFDLMINYAEKLSVDIEIIHKIN
jgi:DNA-binding XRE family transcriptional regulator